MIIRGDAKDCENLIKKCKVEDRAHSEKIKKGFTKGFYKKYIYLLYHDKKQQKYYFTPATCEFMLEKNEEKSCEIKYKGKPREEQQKVLNYIDTNKIRAGLIEMKTARGKTHLMMQIMAKLGEKTLICLHSTGMFNEIKEQIKENLGIEVGMYYSKKKEIKDITITTHKSFSDKIEEFSGKFGLLIIDECDINISPKMIRSLCLGDFDAVFGLTGTPDRQDIGLDGLKIIFGEHIKIEGQSNNGYNFLPTILQLDYYNSVYSFENYQQLRELMVNDEKRMKAQTDFIINQFKYGKTKVGVLLLERNKIESVVYYEFFKKIKEKIGYVGIMNGSTNLIKDKETVKQLSIAGKGLIIGTSAKIGRGKDIPMFDSVFLFFPNKFKNQTVQAVGRGLRFYGNKDTCMVYDRCDLPILVQQKKERLKTYIKEYPGCKINSLHIK